MGCSERFFVGLGFFFCFFEWTSCNFLMIPGVGYLKSTRYHKTQYKMLKISVKNAENKHKFTRVVFNFSSVLKVNFLKGMSLAA